jgi:hypothetical protein
MDLYYTLFYITTAVVTAILILKTYLFVSKSHFHQFTDWLHFSKYNIYTSQNNKIVKAKQTQNTLSNFILILIILDAGLLFMAHFVQL